MTINIENEQETAIPFDYRETADAVIRKVLDEEKCPYEAEVSLTLVTPEEIHRMNRDFRGIDKETDVLSFPMVQYDPPADYSVLEDEETAADCFNPETGELMLGDIIINVDQAARQAEAYGHSLLREYSFLIAHSMLHLLGYDHMTEAEARVMEEKQARYLDELGIRRDSAVPDGRIRTDVH